MTIEEVREELKPIISTAKVFGDYLITESQFQAIINLAHAAGMQEGVREMRAIDEKHAATT